MGLQAEAERERGTYGCECRCVQLNLASMRHSETAPGGHTLRSHRPLSHLSSQPQPSGTSMPATRGVVQAQAAPLAPPPATFACCTCGGIGVCFIVPLSTTRVKTRSGGENAPWELRL